MEILVEGIVSDKVYELIKKGFIRSDNGFPYLVFFVTYSKFNINIGHNFNKISSFENNSLELQYNSVLLDVTNQSADSLDLIEEGYKTICKIGFPNGIPDMDFIKVKDWHVSNQRYLFTS